MNKNSFYVVSVGKNINGARIVTLTADLEFVSDLTAFRFMIKHAIEVGCNSMGEALEKFAVIMTPAGLTSSQLVEAIEAVNSVEIANAAVKKTFNKECNCPVCVNKRAAEKMGSVKEDPLGDILGAFLNVGVDLLLDALKESKKDAKRSE